MAFVNDEQTITRGVWAIEGSNNLTERQDAPVDFVGLEVLFPHRDEFGRADDGERVALVVLLKHAGDSGRHQGLAQSHHITEQHPAAAMQIMGCQRNSSFLKIEQGCPFLHKDARQAKGAFSFAGFFREVLCDLEIDEIRAYQLGARPTLLNQLSERIGQIESQFVLPALIEPLLEFLRGILLDHIHIEFPLLGKSRKGEVTAAHKADERSYGIVAPHKIEFCVEEIPQKGFQENFASPKLDR